MSDPSDSASRVRRRSFPRQTRLPANKKPRPYSKGRGISASCYHLLFPKGSRRFGSVSHCGPAASFRLCALTCALRHSLLGVPFGVKLREVFAKTYCAPLIRRLLSVQHWPLLLVPIFAVSTIVPIIWKQAGFVKGFFKLQNTRLPHMAVISNSILLLPFGMADSADILSISTPAIKGTSFCAGYAFAFSGF